MVIIRLHYSLHSIMAGNEAHQPPGQSICSRQMPSTYPGRLSPDPRTDRLGTQSTATQGPTLRLPDPLRRLILLGYPVFLRTCSHSKAAMRQSDATCPRRSPSDTKEETGEQEQVDLTMARVSGPMGSFQWQKPDGTKQFIWVSRSRDRGREKAANMQT